MREIRALAIAHFYTCDTFAGGVFGPALFGNLAATGSRERPFRRYLAGALAMVVVVVGAVEAFLGVDAERRSLESIARPLAGHRPAD